jgi:hypothetical protein
MHPQFNLPCACGAPAVSHEDYLTATPGPCRDTGCLGFTAAPTRDAPREDQADNRPIPLGVHHHRPEGY